MTAAEARLRSLPTKDFQEIKRITEVEIVPIIVKNSEGQQIRRSYTHPTKLTDLQCAVLSDWGFRTMMNVQITW